MEISERYKIIRPLGIGNRRKFGSIFLVLDKESGVKGVMKVVSKSQGSHLIADRLKSEATFNFSESGLPKIMDWYESETEMMVVRNWVEAKPLDVYFNSLKRKERHEAMCKVLEQLSHRLNVIHSHRIYHCDLKPGNILISPDNKVHLIDFGLALRKPISKERELIFPLGYAAPELLLNRLHLVDHRTDYYALGITLWRLYSGRLPLTHPNPGIFTNLQLTHPLPESNDVPRKIQKLLEKLCAKHSFRVPPNAMSDDEVDSLLFQAMELRYGDLNDFLDDFKNARRTNWFTR